MATNNPIVELQKRNAKKDGYFPAKQLSDETGISVADIYRIKDIKSIKVGTKLRYFCKEDVYNIKHKRENYQKPQWVNGTKY